MKEKTGFIYILTNEAFHKSNWIKIGYTDNIERRLNELYNTSIPTPFEVYATYEVPVITEKNPDIFIHNIIKRLNPNLRIASNREFFEIEPWDAYEILNAMALLHGRQDKLKRNDKNNYGSNMIEESEESYTEDKLFNEENKKVLDLYNEMKKIIKDNFSSLEIISNKYYVCFKKNNKNVFSIWPKANSLEIVLHAKIGTIKDNSGLLYDISNRKWTKAQYAFKFDETADKEIVKNLLEQTYNLI